MQKATTLKRGRRVNIVMWNFVIAGGWEPLRLFSNLIELKMKNPIHLTGPLEEFGGVWRSLEEKASSGFETQSTCYATADKGCPGSFLSFTTRNCRRATGAADVIRANWTSLSYGFHARTSRVSREFNSTQSTA